MQEAQTDKWEKRWAKDRITMTRFERRNQISLHRTQLKEAKNLAVLKGIQRRIGQKKMAMQNKITQAQKKLQ